MNFKNIHIGNLIAKKAAESKIEILRICNFFKCSEEEIEKMYQSKSLGAEIILKWSKLLEYDFFRLYSQHLILYAPSCRENRTVEPESTALPQFRKNIYTKEIIEFMLELIQNGEKTKHQVIEEYKIPKTTLYKWITKYKI